MGAVAPVAAGVSGARSEEAGGFFERSARRERRRSDGDLWGAIERSRAGFAAHGRRSVGRKADMAWSASGTHRA